MELINQFIEDYKSKFNYYDMAARLGAKLLEEALRSSGIRAIGHFQGKKSFPFKSQGGTAQPETRGFLPDLSRNL